MKISKNLRLVIPIETEQGPSHVHAQAISRETYERFSPVFVRAFSNLVLDSGKAELSFAPKVAATYMRRAAKDLGVSDVELLFAEIRRLANVAVQAPNSGWDMVPLDEVFSKSLIDDDARYEVENTLAFFTLGFWMLKRSEREPVMTETSRIWGGQVTSSDFTEFVASLPMSIATASSGEKKPESSAIY